ncbi:MAG: hypothetical protein CTY16_11800 [Methylobacter sp.]|nr:MAG: hypothetical protein CTY16_11800 [Methylobacter sp.]
MPDKAEVAVELAEKWQADMATETAVYRYQLHQAGLLRSLMAEIGQRAGVNGLYWQNGVCVYEQSTRSHALIEQESVGSWQGVIRISTQGGQAGELLARLKEMLKRENNRWGLEPVIEQEPPPQYFGTHVTLAVDNIEQKTFLTEPTLIAVAPSLAFAQPPQSKFKYCLSYAWGDDSEAGKARELIVEQLCQQAEAKGIHILRDKQDLKLGDRLSVFMKQIGQGERVFVILSDKYLKSANCMYELFEIWRNSRHDENELLQRVRVFSTDCAKIFSPLERVQYAVHWKQQHQALKAEITEHGPEILGVEDFRKFKLMNEFARHIGDMLVLFADTIHAQKFTDFEQYGFDDELIEPLCP